MISTSTRKRGASFLLEKPLVSRLPFEVEQPLPLPDVDSSSGFPTPKRPCLSPTIDQELDQELDATSETSEMQEMMGTEEVEVAGVEFEERGCWLAELRVRDKQGRSRSDEGAEGEGVGHGRARAGDVGVGLGLPSQDTQKEQVSALPAAETSGKLC